MGNGEVAGQDDATRVGRSGPEEMHSREARANWFGGRGWLGWLQVGAVAWHVAWLGLLGCTRPCQWAGQGRGCLVELWAGHGPLPTPPQSATGP